MIQAHISSDKGARSICVGGKLMSFDQPKVMGILNATPDSFHSDSRSMLAEEALRLAERHIREGADLLDLGAYSTRPGAEEVSMDEELRRLIPLVEKISSSFPEIPLSVDTFRSDVAREAVQAGAALINDVSSGEEDESMISTVVELGVPYILMHKQGNPKTMQDNPRYDDVVIEVFDYLVQKLSYCRSLGIRDLILDPGFGFGKNNRHNFQLLRHLSLFKETGVPVLAGLSRKGMVWRNLGVEISQALNGTTVLHTIALLKGANLLRVHDVKAAREAVALCEIYLRELPALSPEP